MLTTSDMVRRLWSLCSVLRDEGVTYHEYMNELTYPLFLKLANDLGIEGRLPEALRWATLLEDVGKPGLKDRYLLALQGLSELSDPVVHAVYSDASSRVRTDAGVARLIRGLEAIEWDTISSTAIGDMYEGLIQKSAQESRYGAGQYFTPRALVDAVVAVTRPSANDSVYDPAAGTGGFLVAAGLAAASTPGQAAGLHGVELSADVQRLAVMNLMLHGLDADIVLGDALTDRLAPNKVSICITNPPFGTKGSVSTADVEHLQFKTSSKQLAFVQHVYAHLAPGGRAAIVVPDNVLFETGPAQAIRTHMLDNFDVHTILRLPTGIFYATGVKTSVLFFSRPSDIASDAATRRVWFYDMRQRGRSFTKRHQLSANDFADFVRSYGADPYGKAKREQHSTFTEISRRDLSLDQDRLDHGAAEPEPTFVDEPAATLKSVQAELSDAASAIEALIALLDDQGKPVGDM